MTLSQASGSPVTVAYRTVDGSALAGTSYTATSGTLTFAAGTLSMTFTVPIKAVTSSTAAKNFSVILSAPTGATLGKSSGTVTITS